MEITNLVKKRLIPADGKQPSVCFMTELKTVFWIEKHACRLLQRMPGSEEEEEGSEMAEQYVSWI